MIANPCTSLTIINNWNGGRAMMRKWMMMMVRVMMMASMNTKSSGCTQILGQAPHGTHIDPQTTHSLFAISQNIILFL